MLAYSCNSNPRKAVIMTTGTVIDTCQDYSNLLHSALRMHRYGKLAWKWHPLNNLAYRSDANDKFRKIAEAYEILSDGV